MKVEGLDRVVMMVKDLDKVHEFFSGVLGIEFTEVKDPLLEASGLRCSLSIDHQIEIMSAAGSLPETAPPHLKRFAELLKQKDNWIVALAFKVKNPADAAAEVVRKGIRIEAQFDLDKLGPMANVKEAIINEEDTLGIPICFVNYERR